MGEGDFDEGFVAVGLEPWGAFEVVADGPVGMPGLLAEGDDGCAVAGGGVNGHEDDEVGVAEVFGEEGA